MTTDPSDCPQCGEWRDSPQADCAKCGYAPITLVASLTADRVAVAMNTAQIKPSELALGHDLRPVARRLIAALASGVGPKTAIPTAAALGALVDATRAARHRHSDRDVGHFDAEVALELPAAFLRMGWRLIPADALDRHGVGMVDKLGVSCLCDAAFSFESGAAPGGWVAFNLHLRTAIGGVPAGAPGPIYPVCVPASAQKR